MGSFHALAQKVTRVELMQSESFIGLKRNGENTNKVIKPIFKQDNATLTCDSAYFYLEKNSFEAFGHVHINQSDTINIYSDHLNYDGNSKLAILKGNVKLTDNDAILTTNDFDYDLGTKIGTYYNGGTIVNDKNILTSQNGYYFTQSKDAYFRYNVVVKSPEVVIKSDTLKYNTASKIAYFFGPTNIYGKTDTLYTENGLYNTNNDQASFGKKNLYTQNSKSLKGDSLFYDGKAGYGKAVKNILFIDTAQKIQLRGDLGIYKKKDESIMVTKNAYVIFTTEKDSVSKDSVWMTADTLVSRVLMKKDLYNLQQKALILANISAVIKDSLVASLDVNSDSLNITPPQTDSLKTGIKDSAQVKPVKKEETKKAQIVKDKKGRLQAIDIGVVVSASSPPVIWPNLSVVNFRKLGLKLIYPPKKSIVNQLLELPAEASDTTKIRLISAFKKVKIFKSDLQAVADSAFFSYGDSVLRIYQKPIVWAKGTQLSADTMYVQMKNKKVDNMDLIRNAIVVNTEKDSLQFNQVAGKTMKGYFKNEKLDVFFVNGNAESIYFPNDTSENKGMMRSIASKMRINFTNDSLMQISFIRQPEHNYYPIAKVTEELRTLPNFNWKPKDRPKSKEDIIPTLRKKIVVKSKEKTKLPEKKKATKKVVNDKAKEAKPAIEPIKLE
jgi:lipopolysaccharide export system protein LptA